MSRISEAKSADCAAKGIEAQLRVAEESQKERLRKHALSLRVEAGEIYETWGDLENAGHSYSKASNLAYQLRNHDLKFRLRVKAIKCLDTGGLYKDTIFDLLCHGESMLWEGIRSYPIKARRFLIGVGMQAIDEALQRASEYNLKLTQPMAIRCLSKYSDAKRVREIEKW